MKYKIYINEDYVLDEVSVFIRDERDGNIYLDGDNLCRFQRPESAIVTVPEWNNPFLKLPMRFWNDLLPSLIKYGNDKGLNIEQKSFTEGKLLMVEKENDFLRENIVKILDKVIK